MQPILSIIIPAYNENTRLPHTLLSLSKYAKERAALHELVIVDDGSTDGTADIVRKFITELDPQNLVVNLLINDRNRGKGYSVRRGMLQATGSVRLLCDADLSTPIEEFDRLQPLLRQVDIVIASRDMPDSNLQPAQPWTRRAMAKSLRTIRRIFLLRQLRDTQCGFKLFTADSARAVFSEATVDGFAFDVEVLTLAEQLGYRTIEAGVIWRNDLDSRVRPLRDGVEMLLTVLKIWWRQ